MNRLTIALAAWVLAGLEVGFARSLAAGPASPSLLMALLVLVALFAGASETLWVALALGAITDLLWSVPLSGGGAGIVLGPHALGFVLAAQLVLSLRGSMMRRNPLVLGLLAFSGACVASACVTAIMTLRDLYDPIAWAPQRELLTRLGAAGLTGLAGAALALVLLPLSPLFGFSPSGPGRRHIARR